MKVVVVGIHEAKTNFSELLTGSKPGTR